MAYPTPAPRTVPVVRIPVAVLIPLTVLAVAGLLVWGGGDTAEFATTGASDGGGFASSGAGDDSASPGATPTPAPLIASNAMPPGGVSIAPTESRALLAWRVPGEWRTHLAAYQSSFPISGYRLGEQRLTSTADDGTPLGGGWDIEPDQAGPQVGVGLLYIGPDPADPASTIVEIEVY